MAVLYVGLAVIIIITNITAVPAALASIVKSAFTGSALAGGAVGSMFVAMQKGVARGIFSNESGLVVHRSQQLQQEQKSRSVRDLCL